MAKLFKLPVELTRLIKLRDKYDRLVNNYADEFVYITVVHAYGSHETTNWNNIVVALEHCSMYNGDNGYCYVYTDNPDCIGMECYGDTYHVRSVSEYEQYKKHEL